MEIVIDRDTRREICQRFKLSPSMMTHILRYENYGIVARRVRAYIVNQREYHIV